MAFSSSALWVTPGGTVELSYTVKNATSITIRSFRGETLVENSAELSSSVVTSAISITTSFELTAQGAGGTKMATVVVGVDESMASIETFTAAAELVPMGNTVKLSWTTLGTTKVELRRGQTVLSSSTAASGSFDATVDEASVTFTLEASNPQASTTRDVTVRGLPLPEIARFEVTPDNFSGASATVEVSWHALDADSMTLTANGTAVPGFSPAETGTITVDVTGSTEFELVATSAAGSVRASARVDKAQSEAEPNDDAASATALAAGAIAGAIDPEDDADFYAVQIPNAGSIRAEVDDGNGGCEFSAAIALFAPDGTTLIGQVSSSLASGSCAVLDPQSELWARDLAGGTYYLSVASFAGTGNYVLAARSSAAACGNGIIETLASEQCDDANTSAGDGCNANCEIEASRTAAGPGSVGSFSSALARSGQIDSYRVLMASAGAITARLHVPTVGQCSIEGENLRLDLRGSDGALIGTVASPERGACAAIDAAQMSWASVAAGTYSIDVFSQAPDLLTDYVLDVRTSAPGCGNGILEAAETCDDGNMTAGDGCDATCNFEGLSEVDPNGDATTATLIATMPARIRGSIDPGDDVDYYAITVSEGEHLEVWITANSLEQCNTTALVDLSLYDTDGTTLLSADSLSNGNCGRLDANITDAAHSMAGGTYYIAVTSLLAERITSYYVHAQTVAPGCGNGYADAGEQCDDGNTTPGDSCNATCAFEIAYDAGAVGGSQAVNLGTPGAVQYVEIEVPTAGFSLDVMTSDGANGCAIDTRLTLLDSAGESLGEVDDGAAFPCAGIVFPFTQFATDLAAGTYYVMVENVDQAGASVTVDVALMAPRCGDGLIQTRAAEDCDDLNTVGGDGCDPSCRFEPGIGLEVEPNDDMSVATNSGAAMSSTVTLAASIDPATDTDHFTFEVPPGTTATLVAQTYDRLNDRGSCAIDTVMTLLDGAGAALLQADDGGAGFCSRVDGGSQPEAANLAPGTYYIRVQSYEGFDVIDRYFLDIELR